MVFVLIWSSIALDPVLTNPSDQFLKLTKREHRVRDLCFEPLIFCQSDLFPDNFIVDAGSGNTAAIDFAAASIVPSSFAKFSVMENRLGFDIQHDAYVPMAPDVDNVVALSVLSGMLILGS